MLAKSRLFASLLLVFLSLGRFTDVLSWPAHPLISAAALKNHPHWQKAAPVKAKTLEQFVIDNKAALASFLEAQEKWSIENLPHYVPMPPGLAFGSNVADKDALQSFLKAIRINPNARIPLYLHIPAGDSSSLPGLDPAQVSTLGYTNDSYAGKFVSIQPGMQVDPFLVLNSANDEPDYGLDLGLFEDNNTDYGRIYGFGNQTFGNPKLEFGSQAPFHMGFYYEPGIVYKFAPFLHKTFLDYRHNLYRALSAFAFSHNEPYWGYRFLGWSMHYLADATMPYHVRPLPGYSTTRMLWINFRSVLGYKKAQRKAVQLVSNRHIGVEDYLHQRLEEIYRQRAFDDPLYQALIANEQILPVGYDFLVKDAAKTAAKASRKFDKAIRKGLPGDMVNNPAIEVSQHPQFKNIVAYTQESRSPARVAKLEESAAKRFEYLGMVLRSMLTSLDNQMDNK